MKKALLLLLCTAFLMCGCSMTDEIKREVKEEVSDVKQDINEISSSMSGVDKTKFIGEEKAKELALEKAEISADGVVFDRVELENDGGVWQYEIEFRKDMTEYSADIVADSGEIISWEIDND